MIGVLDLAQQRRVQTALEQSDHPIEPFPHPDAALHALSRTALDALVIETTTLGDLVRSITTAAQEHGVPTLVVSRDRSVGAAVDALRAGATDYLVSPFEYDSLLRSVHRLLDASGAASAGVDDPSPFVTMDPDMREMLELVRSVAGSDATILIEGESGTGKELLARLVHECSPRRNREMISVNCAALPPGLLESELFGHERGAFTGAVSRSIGKFELAHGSTILLDEIGELEIGLQAKLLRALQEKQVQRIGARRPVNVDFRLVATTNRCLIEEARAGRFREDLFYRLNVIPIRLKPLRERRGDLARLIDLFLDRHVQLGRRAPRFPADTLAILQAHAWPGNVRELENLIERLVLTCGGRDVRPSDLSFSNIDPGPVTSPSPTTALPPFRTIREMERWLIVDTLRRLDGNRTQAARELGISLRTLRNKIREYQVDEPETLPRAIRLPATTPTDRRIAANERIRTTIAGQLSPVAP